MIFNLRNAKLFYFIATTVLLSSCTPSKITNTGITQQTQNPFPVSNNSYLSDIGSNKSTTVTVTGIGETLNKAQNNAFRNAIQKASGSLTITQRTVINDTLKEEDLSYSKGIIEQSRLLNSRQDPSDNLWRVNMIVTVSETAIGKKLLYSNDPKSINGSEIQQNIAQGITQIKSEQIRHAQALQLLNHLAENLPLAIWDTQLGKLEVTKDGGNIVASVPSTVSINKEVITNFCQAAKNFDKTGFAPSNGSKILSFDEVLIAYEQSRPPLFGCSGSAIIPNSTWEKLAYNFSQTGFCLTMFNQSQFPIHKTYFMAKLIQKDNEPDRKPSSGLLISSGRYAGDYNYTYANQFSSGAISSDYLNLMRLDYQGGHRTTFKLPLPSNLDYYQGVQSMEIKVAYKNGC